MGMCTQEKGAKLVHRKRSGRWIRDGNKQPLQKSRFGEILTGESQSGSLKGRKLENPLTFYRGHKLERIFIEEDGHRTKDRVKESELAQPAVLRGDAEKGGGSKVVAKGQN